jgi:hypothetical protein
MKAKEFVPASKPRNFVAKNQKTAGAGAHKDKKRAEKQGDIKHKKQVMPMEGSSQSFDMKLAKILKQRGYKGPVKLEQLGMEWVEEIGDTVDLDDLVMIQGNDPEYDGWVSYVFGLGKYAYGAEGGYTTGTAKRVEIDTKADQGMAERVRDPEDWDEGDTEPPNNFAVYINGKKWKVFKGRGQFADDYKEMQHFRQLQNWAQQKSSQTGKKWEVYKTGEQATESVEEGWKEKLGAAALAGSLAFGAAGANARVLPGADPSINRFTGEPIATQQIKKDTEERKNDFSTEYLKKVAAGKHPRPMISVDDAKKELERRGEL